jgi:parallel beta-helix repeat protein
MTRLKLRSYLMASFWILAGVATPLLVAGDLNPPVGPVGPTMKTLQQVEPRTDVQTLSGTPTATYFISAPGSYYLTNNILGEPGKHGIEIDSPNVTLDLRGFALIGAFEFGTSGVIVSGGIISGNEPSGVGPSIRHSIYVYNGSVEGWGDAGINLNNASNSRVEKIRAYFNTGAGVAVNFNSSVVDCHAENNSNGGIRAGNLCTIQGCTALWNGNGGIRAGSSASISNCTAESNTYGGFFTERASTLHNCSARSNFGAPAAGVRGGGGGSGFDLDDSCSVSNCSGDQNNGDGLFAFNHLSVTNSSFVGNGGDGIEAFDQVTASNCSTSGNSQNGIYINNGTVASCSASQNGQSGIAVFFSDSEIRDNTCVSNFEHGIVVADRSRVTGNHCASNGSFAGGFSGAGISVVGDRSTLDQNSISNNDDGIMIVGNSNVVVRNIASVNTTNYNITGLNDVGPLGLAASLTSPWGNIDVTPAPTCVDGIQNGNETGIDCGGGTCPPCPNGQGCNSASDCLSGNCSGGLCIP